MAALQLANSSLTNASYHPRYMIPPPTEPQVEAVELINTTLMLISIASVCHKFPAQDGHCPPMCFLVRGDLEFKHPCLGCYSTCSIGDGKCALSCGGTDRIPITSGDIHDAVIHRQHNCHRYTLPCPRWCYNANIPYHPPCEPCSRVCSATSEREDCEAKCGKGSHPWHRFLDAVAKSSIKCPISCAAIDKEDLLWNVMVPVLTAIMGFVMGFLIGCCCKNQTNGQQQQQQPAAASQDQHHHAAASQDQQHPVLDATASIPLLSDEDTRSRDGCQGISVTTQTESDDCVSDNINGRERRNQRDIPLVPMRPEEPLIHPSSNQDWPYFTQQTHPTSTPYAHSSKAVRLSDSGSTSAPHARANITSEMVPMVNFNPRDDCMSSEDPGFRKDTHFVSDRSHLITPKDDLLDVHEKIVYKDKDDHHTGSGKCEKYFADDNDIFSTSATPLLKLDESDASVNDLFCNPGRCTRREDSTKEDKSTNLKLQDSDTDEPFNMDLSQCAQENNLDLGKLLDDSNDTKTPSKNLNNSHILEDIRYLFRSPGKT